MLGWQTKSIMVCYGIFCSGQFCAMLQFTWILYSVFWFLQQSMSHAQNIHVWSSREDYQVALFFDTIILETIQGIF